LKSCFAGVNIVDGGSIFPGFILCLQEKLKRIAMEEQEHWYRRRAVEQLAQHIPFEQNLASKAEQIEMLRELVIHYGRNMDPDLFGFEARNELIRLGLWSRIGQPEAGQQENS
jgi:hypothetical protein